MNFFQAQEQARKRTRWLVLWFTGGVIGTVTCLFAVVVAGTEFLKQEHAWEGDWWNHPSALWTAVIGMFIIMVGSAYKLQQLSAGGSVIALDLGARPIDLSSRAPMERQLLNVVEEMAIASGIPVPQVWVMDDERSINAFAAGTEPANAVIGVSRGCLEQLSRDELQGVVAHEFSHILNGDMRLNVRLIGWVFGLLMIAMLGRGLMASIRYIRVSSSRDNNGNIPLILALMAAGFCLWLIGSLGVLFGRIIQSAVSRQREFLADASAVQFTRNPTGIAGALKKIMVGGNSRLRTPAASEAAHLFFSRGVSGFFQQWFATHPPLDERIRAIDRSWTAQAAESGQAVVASTTAHGAIAGFAGANAGHELVSDRGIDLGQAQQLRHTMASRGSIDGLDDAKGLALAMVVTGPRAAWPTISQTPTVLAAIEKWQLPMEQMTSAEKIGWMEISFPWLREMHKLEYQAFCADLQCLIESDGKVSLFEWMIFHALRRHLHGYFDVRRLPRILWHELEEVEEPLAELLACFSSLMPDRQYGQVLMAEYQQMTQRPLPQREADFSRIDEALQILEQASPLVKSQILHLCRTMVEADGVMSEEEWQMQRAVADALGVPLVA
jgi:Zn-dependent protease with chaperone function